MKTNAERDSAAIKVLRNKLFFLVGSKVGTFSGNKVFGCKKSHILFQGSTKSSGNRFAKTCVAESMVGLFFFRFINRDRQ
jgi:hypothetical protein